LDVTPIIDVVFLLITFFLLVCQFIAAENFDVLVPDRISSAAGQRERQESEVTVSVMYRQGRVCYAVGAETLEGCVDEFVGEAVRTAVESRFADRPGGRRVVCLRCDKRMEFGRVQEVLRGISASSAERIRWAVLRDKEL
jgi:biopolymer transport protein ExbD